MHNLLRKALWRPIINTSRPNFCEHILDKALLEKWPVSKTHEPFVVELPIPAGSEAYPEIHRAFIMHQRTGFPAQYLVCIPEGVAAGGGFVRLSTGEFLTQSTWRIDYLTGDLGADIYRARYRRNRQHLKGDWYYLDMLFSGNYAHWFLDELPRLASALPFLPPTTKFIVSQPCQDYKIKSLVALGIAESRLLPVEGYFESQCERLWFATPLGSCEWASTSPQIFNQIRKTLLAAYCPDNIDAPEKIFVSRSGAPSKRLANESELLPMIKDYGFEVVRTEALTFVEQVRIFSRAKYVLCAHGAGMTNLLFAPQVSELLELQDEQFAPRLWYWKVASLLGHSYSSLVGPVKRFSSAGDTDFEIKSGSLKEYLEIMISPSICCSPCRWSVSK